jgi:hypothetical protein
MRRKLVGPGPNGTVRRATIIAGVGQPLVFSDLRPGLPGLRLRVIATRSHDVGTSRRQVILRPALMIAAAAIMSACATSSSPDAGSGAPSSSGAPVPSASGPPPETSPSAAGSSASPADAFVDVPASEGVPNAISAADGMIVVDGFSGPVFTSTILAFDGSSWSVADVPDAPGQVAGIARLGDRWIAVGNGLPDIRNGFIWSSADGRSWEPVQTVEDAALYDVIAGEGVVVAVGADLDAEMNATAAAWSSTDGATWQRATVAGPDKASMGSVATTPDGFIATGDRRLGESRPIWVAMTATSWEALDNDLTDQLLPTDIVAWGDQYALVGASGKSGDQHPFVALSSDGQVWKRTNLSDEEGYASAVAVANERLMVAGIDYDRLTLWSLNDGAWKADTYEPSGASISALMWDSELGLVAVGARGGSQATWVFGDQ